MSVQFIITPLINSALVAALSSDIPDDTRKKIQPYVPSDTTNTTKTIPLSHLQELSKYLRTLNLAKGNTVWLHELVQGSHVVVPSIPKPVYTEEEIRMRSRLKARYDNMQYDKMTKNVRVSKEEEQRQEQAEMADFKSQLGMGVNMVFGMGATMVFGWFVGKRLFNSDLVGVVFGLILACVVLIAETLLFAIKLSRVDGVEGKPAQSGPLLFQPLPTGTTNQTKLDDQATETTDINSTELIPSLSTQLLASSSNNELKKRKQKTKTAQT